jgi:DUF4097 and DUF4098 domain-containing protein YvlB
MRPHTNAARAPLALLAAAVLQPLAATAQEAERHALTGDVAIFNIAGIVTIERGGTDAVVVELTRGGADAGRLRVETGRLESWQTLRVIYPDREIVYPRMRGGSRAQFAVAEDGTFGGEWGEADHDFNLGRLLRALLGERGDRTTVRGSGGGVEAYADVRILVPAGRTVAVQLGVGEVHASNIDGRLLVDTRSGPVVASQLRGHARLGTGSGRIELDGAEGDVRLETGSGSIRASDIAGERLSLDTGSGNVTASDIRSTFLDIDTGSGSVQVAGVRAERVGIDTGSGSVRIENGQTQDLEVDTGSGSVTVDLLTRVRDARIDTGSGGVTLTVPADFGALLDLSAGSGGISTDLPVQIQEKKRTSLRGTIGDGGARVVIDTGSGGIRIRSR